MICRALGHDLSCPLDQQEGRSAGDGVERFNRIWHETRLDDVCRLVRLRDRELGFERVTEAGRLMMQGSQIGAEGQPFDVILTYHSSHLDRPIVDQTGLDNGTAPPYNFDMRFAIGVEGSLEEALDGLGLDLVKADDTEAESLVVESARE